jgi:subtilisin family serine protease
MIINKRLLTGSLSVVVLAAAMWVGTATHTADAGTTAVAAGTGRAAGNPSAGVLTLISGDRVAITAGRAGEVTPGPGRENIGFVRQRLNGDEYVVPSDAVDAVGRGVLDLRLFNVTRLLKEHGDDKAAASVGLIIQYADGSGGDDAQGAVRAAGAQDGQPVPALSARAHTVAKKACARLWAQLISGGTPAPGVRRVWLDAKARVLLDRSVPQTGAPTAWRAGFTGKDVPVAVLDSGYDPQHPDLAGRVAASRNFVATETDVVDRAGHGTHVAATVGGSGAASAGRFQGMAPGSRLLVGRVCDGDGSCPDSAVLAGMQWAVDSGARVVNMSLGAPDQPGIDPLEEAVNTLTARTGVLFVVAAGNDGPRPGSLGSPGSADAALTVGSVDHGDSLADSSSRGPRAEDSALKPELTAPGVDIVAARATGTGEGEAVDAHYIKMSGTSMAAPHVAGAATILAQQHPDWKAEQLKAALIGTASPVPGSAFQVGAGRVDVGRAATQPGLFATPPVVSFGLQKWPQQRGQTQPKTLTYHNPTTEAIAFELRLTVTGPGGKPAPAGMFTVPPRLVVPAGGQADIVVSGDAAILGPAGAYSGVLTAATPDGRVQLRTPLGLDREPESYEHTFTALDRAGKATNPFLALYRLPVTAGSDKRMITRWVDGTAKVRLPRGRWAAVFAAGEDDGSQTIGAQPELVLDKDTSVVFDTRNGKEIDVTVPEPGARLFNSMVGIIVGEGDGIEGTALFGPGSPTETRVHGVYAIPTPTQSSANFLFFTHGVWAKPTDKGFADSPYVYNVMLPTTAGIPAKPAHAVTRAELATVTFDYGPGAPNEQARATSAPGVGPMQAWSMGPGRTSLPGRRTHYFATGGDTVAWTHALEFPDSGSQQSPPRAYKAGQQYSERWNHPVFGPSLPPRPLGRGPFMARREDTIAAGIPLFSDGVLDHFGDAGTSAASAELYRDGEKIGTSPTYTGIFEVPTAEADYRLIVTGTRDPAQARASSTVTAEWTFRSGHVTGKQIQALPLSAVRYVPQLDKDDRAAPGPAEIALVTQSQIADAASDVRTHTLEMSDDDGRTWHNAPVQRTPTGWTAAVTNPTTPGAWVSLRSSLTRADGGTVKQTVLRAYQVR